MGKALGLLLLASMACEAHTSTSASTSSTPGIPMAIEPVPVCSAEDAKENCHHWIVLEGLTVEEAVSQARAAGFELEIRIATLDKFEPDCKPDTVCRADPKRWQLNSDTLWLWRNPKMTITAP